MGGKKEKKEMRQENREGVSEGGKGVDMKGKKERGKAQSKKRRKKRRKKKDCRQMKFEICFPQELHFSRTRTDSGLRMEGREFPLGASLGKTRSRGILRTKR